MIDAGKQIKYSYLAAVVGVALVTITATFGLARVFTIRQIPRGGFGGNTQLANVNPFGLTNSLTILGVIVAIIGLAWLGMALRKSHNDATKPS